MKKSFIRPGIITQAMVVVVGLVMVVWPNTSRAQLTNTVYPGWDLLYTIDAQLANPGLGAPFLSPFLEFTGSPLGTHNFGSGDTNVGNTDTIIQRMTDAVLSPSGSATIGIQVDALQLIGVNTGAGLFATLDPNTSSTGWLTINSDGSWTNNFTVYFDLFLGTSTNGSFLGQGTKNFMGSGSWTNVPAIGDLLIAGVNSLLNTNNHLNDFFLVGQALHDDGHGSTHIVIDATPEPSSALLAVLGAGAWLMRRKLIRE